MHIGDGVVIHCTSNGGVKYGDLSDTSWTNYAIPKGLYTPEEIEHARGRELVRKLQKGCSGEDVKRLQETLNGLGFNCGKADGIFGQKTKTAVQAFQSAYGLTADGIVGAKTRDKLEDVTGKTGGDETEEDKTDTTENQETPVLPEFVRIPTEKAIDLWRLIGDQLGMTVDARSGNVGNIDYM
jgi:peptidoglycan hydrolase-like protein with peptidoglycan-binding domain